MVQDKTTRHDWVHIAVEAPSDARCTVCHEPVTGTDYRWRSVAFPLLGDMEMAFAHPKCLEDAENAS